jgi:aminopeptidase YwaD
MDWRQDGARLEVAGAQFDVQASPYTLGCRVRAPLAVASTVEELEAVEGGGKVLLIHGELAKEQLMPKNFSFYNPEHHQAIYGLLEAQGPLAIAAATSRNPELAGGLYPFPLFEDGDFDIPSVYMKDKEGARLATHAGQEVELDITAERIPAKGCNVIALKGPGEGRRVVVCAHIDAKLGTPGALDNATGIVVLLLLAELLADYSQALGVELVAFNGEDYYSAPGQVQYLSRNRERFAEIVLATNLDGAGYYKGNTAYSLYDCPPEVASLIHSAFSVCANAVEGEQWYQSDHTVFVQSGVPALAITSDSFTELWTKVAHTPRDRPDIVDSGRLADIALALRELVLGLAGERGARRLSRQGPST